MGFKMYQECFKRSQISFERGFSIFFKGYEWKLLELTPRNDMFFENESLDMMGLRKRGRKSVLREGPMLE